LEEDDDDEDDDDDEYEAEKGTLLLSPPVMEGKVDEGDAMGS